MGWVQTFLFHLRALPSPTFLPQRWGSGGAGVKARAPAGRSGCPRGSGGAEPSPGTVSSSSEQCPAEYLPSLLLCQAGNADLCPRRELLPARTSAGDPAGWAINANKCPGDKAVARVPSQPPVLELARVTRWKAASKRPAGQGRTRGFL